MSSVSPTHSGAGTASPSPRPSINVGLLGPSEVNFIARNSAVQGTRSLISHHSTEAGSTLPPGPAYDDVNSPQLTAKAIISGILSGTVCSFMALYYGMKVGITPSLNILGSLIGYSCCKALMFIPYFKGKFTQQENAVIQTVAVATYFTAAPGFGLCSGYLGMSKEAYDVVGGDAFEGNRLSDTVDLTWWRTVVWCLGLFAFGFFLAFPLKNYYILKRRLLFPSGTATAYILQTLHAGTAASADCTGYLLKFFSIAFGVNTLTWFFNGLSSFPIFGMKAAAYGWLLDFDLGTFGIGMLLSKNTNFSILIGGVVAYGIIQPYIALNKDGDFPGAWFNSATLQSSYLGLYSYALVAGLGVLITQGVWGVGALVVTVARDFIKSRRAKRNGEPQELDDAALDALLDPTIAMRDEIFRNSTLPWWFSVGGYFLFAGLCIIVLKFCFGVEWYYPLITLMIMPIVAFSNIEGMGRTDWDVSAAYGKIIMFPVGALNHSVVSALALCHCIVSGTSNSAVLMQDFKTGYLVGSSPKVMFVAQFIGAIAGCVITPSLFILLRTAFTIPTGDPTAFIQARYGPIYRTLAIVATGAGFDSLPTNCMWIGLAFVLIALFLNVLALLLPEKWAKFVPDPSSMSIGMLVGATVPLEFGTGCLVAVFWKWWDEETATRNVPYICSGMLAGSGISVVFQVLASIANVSPPVVVTWTQNWAKAPSAGGIVMLTIFIVVLVLLTAMALWFWFPHFRLQQAMEREAAEALAANSEEKPEFTKRNIELAQRETSSSEESRVYVSGKRH